jgi:hypothetical protein
MKKITYWFEIRAIEKYDYILVKYKTPYYCSSMVIIYICDCFKALGHRTKSKISNNKKRQVKLSSGHVFLLELKS